METQFGVSRSRRSLFSRARGRSVRYADACCAAFVATALRCTPVHIVANYLAVALSRVSVGAARAVEGSPNSHVSMLARARGVPMIVARTLEPGRHQNDTPRETGYRRSPDRPPPRSSPPVRNEQERRIQEAKYLPLPSHEAAIA